MVYVCACVHACVFMKERRGERERERDRDRDRDRERDRDRGLSILFTALSIPDGPSRVLTETRQTGIFI